jgi:menaquinone reductase, multiheme cytochrome c subunit
MKFFLVGVAIGLILLFVIINLGFTSKIEQPIPFNHKKHISQGLECDTCHPYYKTQNFAGLPDLAICLECHKEPITKSPEEEKIRQYEKKGEQIPWKRLYWEPDHVFYSHRRHVVLGKLPCQTCHDAIGQTERPPSKPWVKMSMGWCMDCHAKMKVTNDCLACHV